MILLIISPSKHRFFKFEVNKGKLENPDGDDDNYGPAEIADQKIHKSGELDLHLARTDDILLCVKETERIF